MEAGADAAAQAAGGARPLHMEALGGCATTMLGSHLERILEHQLLKAAIHELRMPAGEQRGCRLLPLRRRVEQICPTQTPQRLSLLPKTRLRGTATATLWCR